MNEAPSWVLWVDFHRVDGAGLTHANVLDATGNAGVQREEFVLVGDDDADPGVAQIVEVRTDGVVLLRVPRTR